MADAILQPRHETLTTPSFSSAKHVPPPCLTPLTERSALLGLIERQRHKRVLLVHAPAGYGKTVLLSQWRDVVRASGASALWINLERADGSADRFLEGLVSALVHAGIVPPGDPQAMLGEIGPADRLNRILSLAERSTRETWLTIEDWHRVEAAAIGEMVETLLRNLPANWHLAVSSRTRPRFSLLMLRARGQLIEIDQNDLRLTPQEARTALAGTGLPASTTEELVELAEGWAIALRLAQLWLENGGRLDALRSSFLQSIVGMGDFLADEVLTALPPDLLECLVESSICHRFNADLVRFLREETGAADLIETLRSCHGLVIAMDDGHGWLRHHRILAEFLERERRRLPADRIAYLHSRAALWFERHGLLFEAVEHARQSGDEARTVQLVEDAGCVDICIRTGAPAVRALLDSLPSDVIRRRPRLRAAYSAMNLKLGSIGQASDLLAELQASAEIEGMDAVLRRDLLIVQNLRQCFIDESPSDEDIATQRRTVASYTDAEWWLRGLMRNVQGRLEMRRGLLHDAIQSLVAADGVFEGGGSTQGHFFMLANVAMCHVFLGNLRTADSYLRQAHDVLKRQFDGAGGYAGIVHTVEAMLLYERNELPAAGHAAQLALAGLELAEGCFEQYFSSILVAARVAFAASGLDPAVRVIDRGRRLAQYHRLPRMEGLLDRLELRLTIDAGQWDNAARTAAQIGLQPSASSSRAGSPEEGWLEHDFSVPSLCLTALHDDRPNDAVSLARTMAARCRASDRLPAQIRAHVIEALAAAMAHDRDAACHALRSAIRLASSEGILQPFFEVDASVLTLLRDFQRTDAAGLPPIEADFLSALILRVIAAGKAKAHTEHLTARERQILELLRHGGSNKVIARALDLTENAVKFHLKNVFRKLRVDNRAMAAQVAQRIDLGAQWQAMSYADV